MLALTYITWITVALSSHVALALNDWSVPCTSGACEYNWIGDGQKKAFSTLQLAGSQQVLSDITPAAGWRIMGCNPNWEQGPHDIRMVCMGTPEQRANCAHVYETGGAEDTVVRLPDNCGKGPFARVRKTWEPTDQNVTTHLKRQLTAFNQTGPVRVRGLTLDYNLTSIPTTRGSLQFTVTSSNSPDVGLSRRDLRTLAVRGRGRFDRRFNPFEVIKSVFNQATSVIVSVATEVASDVKSVATSVASDVKSVATSIASKIEEADNFNKTGNHDDIPLKLDKNFTLVDLTVQCNDLKNNDAAHLKIDVDAHVDANLNYGYVLSGRFFPPRVDEAAVFAHLSGDASFTFGLEFEAQGQFDTLPVDLFKAGLPLLSIPGLGALGPQFVLAARLEMDVEVAAQIDVTADFQFPDVELSFPKGQGKNSADKAIPQSKGNDVKLSTANAGFDAKGTITATLIPSIEFGIDLDFAKASIFLDLEVGGQLDMKLNGGIGGPTLDAANDESADDSEATDDAANDSTDDEASDGGDDTAAADDTDATDNATASDDGATDDANADDADADDAAANDAGADDANADDAAADDTGAGDASADDAAADDAAVDDAAADDAAAGDAAADDATTDDANGDDAAAVDDVAPEDSKEDAADATSKKATQAKTGAKAKTAVTSPARRHIISASSSYHARFLRRQDQKSTDQVNANGTIVVNGTAIDTTQVVTDSSTTDLGISQNDTSVADLVPQESKGTNGCITLTGVLSVNAGLVGKLLPVFNEEVKFPIFQTSRQLFQKCFGGANATEASEEPAADSAAAQRRRELHNEIQLNSRWSKRDLVNEITPSLSTSIASALLCPKRFNPAKAFLPLLLDQV